MNRFGQGIEASTTTTTINSSSLTSLLTLVNIRLTAKITATSITMCLMPSTIATTVLRLEVLNGNLTLLETHRFIKGQRAFEL